MAAAAKKNAGTTYWIGTTATNGSSDTYTEIKQVKTPSGSFGYSWQMADSTVTSDTSKQEAKTLKDPGAFDLSILADEDDAGQVALKAAADDVSDAQYNFEVRYSQGDKHRMKVKVVSFDPAAEGAATLRMTKAKVSLCEPATYVAPA